MLKPRAGFYAENLLLYNTIAQETAKLPLPIGYAHKFAPVALGDVAHVAAIVATSQGPQGLADNIRGQLITVTGPMMVSGNELANAASQALGKTISFEDIPRYVEALPRGFRTSRRIADFALATKQNAC